MNKIQVKFNELIKYVKNNKKQILVNYLIFIVLFVILLLVDQLTKTFIFVHGDVHNLNENGLVYVNGYWSNPESINYKSIINYGIFGIRSIWHRGVTFLPSTFSITIIQIISILIFIFCLFVPLMINKKLTVFICFIASGDFGNMLDRFIFNEYVKDIFYFPWIDKGTFNLADAWVMIGAVLIFVYLVIELILDVIKKTKYKKQHYFNKKK